MSFNRFAEIKQALTSGTSVLSIVEHYLQNIHSKNADLNIFLEIFEDESKKVAKEIDAKIQAGTAGKLAGMVIALKDNLCYKGHKVSASSKILEGFESLFTATAVERLLAEDAIIIGRVNCDEFAMGSSNENSAFGPVKNPLDPSRVPGGSSGGSAAAVVANMCTVALGSDTGGSIRQPASFCGIVGLKPSYGVISRSGLIAYASSFDQIGPFATNVADVALVTEIMAGQDPKDSTTAAIETKNLLGYAITSPKKIAILKEAIDSEGTSTAVKDALKAKIAKLEALGHTVEYINFPLLDSLVPTYYVLTTAEASSNLARFDGIHYGYRSKEAAGIEDTYIKSRSEGFGEEVQRRIMTGTFVLSAGYYDAYYAKGQKVRMKVKQATEAIFKDFDYLILPTTPTGAFEIGKKSDDPTVMYMEDIFTVQANIAGNPAISLPMGVNEHNMPLGLQVMTGMYEEQKLLSFANYLENEVL